MDAMFCFESECPMYTNTNTLPWFIFDIFVWSCLCDYFSILLHLYFVWSESVFYVCFCFLIY